MSDARAHVEDMFPERAIPPVYGLDGERVACSGSPLRCTMCPAA